jgi:hypothetical protein
VKNSRNPDQVSGALLRPAYCPPAGCSNSSPEQIIICMVFQVASKSGRTYSFFLSSEYERSQWVEALKTLQASLPPNTSQVRALRDEDLPNSGPSPFPARPR